MDAANLLQAGKVVVWAGQERWRLRGMDVVHGELHLIVGPQDPAPMTWAVVVTEEGPRDAYAARTLSEALGLANMDRGTVFAAFEGVEAPDAGAARLAYQAGRHMGPFVWLGS
jgi:hypothetical protein